VPMQLELRRTMVERLSDVLQRKFLKEVSISYV
jgi:hypothetical protein